MLVDADKEILNLLNREFEDFELDVLNSPKCRVLLEFANVIPECVFIRLDQDLNIILEMVEQIMKFNFTTCIYIFSKEIDEQTKLSTSILHLMA